MGPALQDPRSPGDHATPNMSRPSIWAAQGQAPPSEDGAVRQEPHRAARWFPVSERNRGLVRDGFRRLHVSSDTTQPGRPSPNCHAIPCGSRCTLDVPEEAHEDRQVRRGFARTIAGTSGGVALTGMKPKAMLATVRERHPGTTKEVVVGTVYYALGEGQAIHPNIVENRTASRSPSVHQTTSRRRPAQCMREG